MNEADRRRELEIDLLERIEALEAYDRDGAIKKNARAMKATIEEWNDQFVAVEKRLAAQDANIATLLALVKQLQESNGLALQRIHGSGPTT